MHLDKVALDSNILVYTTGIYPSDMGRAEEEMYWEATWFKHQANGWIKHYKFYNLWLPEITPVSFSHGLWIDEPTFRSYLSDGDIMVVNFGAHYVHWTVLDYRAVVTRGANILKEHTLANPDLKVIFRNSLPPHFITKTGTGIYQDAATYDTCSNQISEIRVPTDIIQMEIAKKFGFPIFDEFYIYNTRYDAHSVTVSNDCLHYCHSTELMMAELKAFAYIL